MAFLGICVLLPYNCILTSQPWYDDVFKGLAFPFTSMLAYSLSLCSVQVLMTLYGELLAISARMWGAVVGLLLTSAALCLLAAFEQSVPKIAAYVACLAVVAVMAMTSALMQSAILGLAGVVGRQISAAVMLGLGISGLVSMFVSLLVRSCLRGSEEFAGRVSTVTLYAVCIAITAVAARVYFSLLARRVPAFIEALAFLEHRRKELLEERRRTSRENLEQELPHASFVTQVSFDMPKDAGVLAGGGSEIFLQRSTWNLMGDVRHQALNAGLVFATTMLVFPGVITKWVPGPGSMFVNDKELFGTLMVGCFQAFDVASRLFAGCTAKHLPPHRLWIFVWLRLLLVPAILLGQRRPEWCWLWGSDMGRFLLTAILAFTNGLFGSCAMIFGPEMVDPSYRQTAGMAMSCTMVTGIFAGTLLALLTQM